MPTLQRLGSQVPDTYMAVLGNPGGQDLVQKWNMIIGYVKKSAYKEKAPWNNSRIQGKSFKHNPLKHLL